MKRRSANRQRSSNRSVAAHAMPALLAAALAGCSSCPPFRASWYLDETVARKDGFPIVYLALLNEGSRTVRLTELIVNPQGSTTLPLTRLTLHASPLPGGNMLWFPKLKEPSAQPAPAPKSKGDDAGDDATTRAALEQLHTEAAARQANAQADADSDFRAGKPGFPRTNWQPGQLLVFRIADWPDDKGGPSMQTGPGQCILPVAVEIQGDERCGRPEPVSGTLPNYLHSIWLKRCQPVGAAATVQEGRS
jgi:hypothetical protein